MYVATIGNYDGVHLGHQCLLETLAKVAHTKKLQRLLITFEPHPQELFGVAGSVLRIGLLRDKVQYLLNNNLVDKVLVLQFKHINGFSPNQFIHTILMKHQVKHVVIGKDFVFGRHRAGNATDIAQNGIGVSIVEDFYLVRDKVTSSFVRRLISSNSLELAEKYLGHRITYTARVIYGKQLGRLLQIPTINLCIGKKRLIIHGIYYGYVRFAGDHKVYIAVISAGYNPTVSDLSLYKLEAHLLDFNANVYGSIATVEIVGYIRPEYEFSNLTMLREQMLNDIAFARKCL